MAILRFGYFFTLNKTWLLGWVILFFQQDHMGILNFPENMLGILFFFGKKTHVIKMVSWAMTSQKQQKIDFQATLCLNI